MKNYILFLLVVWAGCKSYPTVKTLNGQLLRGDLKVPHPKSLQQKLAGRWEYGGSFVRDSLVVLDKLGDLSRFYQFEPTDTAKIAEKYPILHRFAREKTLFGLHSLHETRPFGELTYPLVNNWNKDGSTVRVSHYEPGNGVGATHSYFISGLGKNSLLIKNERRYDIDGEYFAGVHHLYRRVEAKPSQ